MLEGRYMYIYLARCRLKGPVIVASSCLFLERFDSTTSLFKKVKETLVCNIVEASLKQNTGIASRCMYPTTSPLKAYTHIHSHTHTHIHSHTHTHIHSHTHTHLHTYTVTHIHTVTHTHIHSHIHTHIHTHTHTYTHVHTRTHTRTHSHTYYFLITTYFLRH